MRISELSQRSQVSARSIRHYEQKGLLEADRLDNDYRHFNASAIERVKIIQLYLKLGLTTDQIRILFRGEVASPDDYEYCEEMLSFYEDKLSSVGSQIAALHELKHLLERQISRTLSKKESQQQPSAT